MNYPLKKRKIGIDLLRGLSILYIVGFWHMFDYTKALRAYENPVTTRITFIILGTFIFISGYFIGCKEVSMNSKNIINFYKQRLLRIYPLYIIAICLFMYFNLLDRVTSLKAVFIVSMLIKPTPLTLWFITMLLFFYVLSPFLIYASKKFKAIHLIIYYLIFCILLIAYLHFTNLLDIRLLMNFPSFALGVYVANKDIDVLRKRHTILSVIIILLCVLFSFLEMPFGQFNALRYVPMILSCSYALFRVTWDLAVSSNHLRKIIGLLSYSSYCMYLFHRPIYISLKKVYFPGSYLYQIIYLVLFCLPCILCCSFIIQKTYDSIIYLPTNKSLTVRKV